MVKWLRDISETLIFALLLLFVLQLAFPRYTIEGPSMQPTLQEGHRIITVPRSLSQLNFLEGADGEEYQVGEIVVFSPPSGFTEDIIKRIVAVGGDEVDIRDGRLYVNGNLSEYNDGFTDGGSQRYPLTVQPGAYFVLGDNRDNSSDSRSWGTLAEGDILGRLLLVYWPFQELRLF